MDRNTFEELLDQSLLAFRQQLLESFPAVTSLEAPPSADGASEGLRPPEEKKADKAASFEVPPLGPVENSENSFELNLDAMERTGSNSVASMWSGTSDPTEPSSPVLKMAAPYLTSRLNGLSDQEAQAVRRRLRLRLGIFSPNTLITGQALHDAVFALGLTRYKVEDMNAVVNLTADFIGLQFQETRVRRISLSSTASPRSKYGRPVWKWPPHRESMMMRRSGSMASWMQRAPPPSKFNCVPAEPLMTLFLAEDAEVQKRIFGPHSLKVFQAVREILLAGDTNRLVAELTFVRINDLAAPPEPLHPLLLLEPFVALLIVANGIMTGVQTELENWDGWLYFELVFTTALLLEILLRISALANLRLSGPSRSPGFLWGLRISASSTLSPKVNVDSLNERCVLWQGIRAVYSGGDMTRRI
ncbi:CACNA1S [Symbiodinium natans]|uniref:CACNA1S protein n=1 Tax=Symbiodinium natans TaxID=878477 RepID=A0A812NQA9_9DINO|nr:CACNA1S [Symbiodinium natans]